MEFKTDDNVVTIFLSGKIDTSNAAETEEQIRSIMADRAGKALTLDAAELVYISSAGLRSVMRLGKDFGSLTLINASSEVYDVFEMTGLTQMMDVRRAMRSVTIDGLEMIGAGANGQVYRLDKERILKVYNPVSNPPEKIVREKQVAREAFIQGIPSALSFEMVRVGDSYGIVYEMIDAMTLGEAIAKEPERLEEYARRMADMLRQLHATEFAEGTLPDARESLHAWVDVAERSGYFTDEVIAAAHGLVESIPPRNTFIHGDFHPGNIMVMDDDELLLIDMGDASVGDPIIDLIGAFQIMRIVADHPGGAERYMGISKEQSLRLWDTFIRAYSGIDNPEELAALEGKLRHFMILRSIAGITFSEVIPPDKREQYAAFLSKVLLGGAPSPEEVAALRK